MKSPIKNMRGTLKSRRENRSIKRREMGRALPAPEKKLGIRLNLLFAGIFLLFLVLIGRLYYMQVLNKAFYAEKLAETGVQTTVKAEQPRGQIFDATGQLLASTTRTPSVTFTRTEKITAPQMRATAIKLFPILRDSIDASNLTDQDKKDYYLADSANLEKVSATITTKDQFDSKGKKLTASAIYQLEVSRVTSDDISHFSDDDLLAAQLYKEMNATALYNTSNIVTGNITPDQQAQIAANLSDMPGIDFGTAWDHTTTGDNLLSPLIGTISTSKSGLPADEAKDLLAKGYSLNDRVGTSYLEKGYESTLQGKSNVTKLVVDSKGNVTKKQTVQEGEAGQSLKLTADLNFENGVQQILKNNENDMLNQGFGQYNTGVYAVVLNLETGGILSVNGVKRDTGTGALSDDTLGAITDAFPPGSIVKPGTLTAGWNANAISGNQTLNDQAIQIAGSNPIESWFTNGIQPITAVQALEYSSNTYMVQVALKMLGQNYSAGMTVDGTNRVKVYDELRKAYGEYGLGVSTGLDFPGESTGLVPSTDSSNASVANVLYEAFGQFDNYTPLQAAQYAATLANGQRLSPHLVGSTYESTDTGTLGKQTGTIGPKVLNSVDISSANLDILHQGMYQVVHGGLPMATGYWMSQNAAVSISAKTGTSQTNVVAADGSLVNVTVNNVVAYAPSDNPKIAIAVMCPNTTVKDGGTTSEISQYVTRDIVNLYNSMYSFK